MQDSQGTRSPDDADREVRLIACFQTISSHRLRAAVNRITGGPEIVAQLSDDLSRASLAYELFLALRRRGQIERELFEALATQAPHLFESIRLHAESWDICELSRPTAAVGDSEGGSARTRGWWRRASDPNPRRSRARQHRREALRRLRGRIDDIVHTTLHPPRPIDLAVVGQPDLVAAPWLGLGRHVPEPAPADPTSSRSDAIVCAAYASAGGNLLLLGAPGAGKTTALVALARTLLTAAEADESQPVPILLNLSSWRPAFASLEAWVLDELNHTLCIPPGVAERWLRSEAFALLLDGLDEVPTAHRRECTEKINAFRRGHMIATTVCTRTVPYLAGRVRLSLEAALELQPLTDANVDHYLSGCAMGEQLRRLIARDLTIRTLARTPLMLCIMLRDVDNLSAVCTRHVDIEPQRQQILRSYCLSMLARRPSPRFSVGDLRRWLTLMARTMCRAGISEYRVERTQPTWLPSRRLRVAFVGISIAIIGLSAYVSSRCAWPIAEWLTSLLPIWGDDPGLVDPIEPIDPGDEGDENDRARSRFVAVLRLLFILLYIPVPLAMLAGGRFLRIETCDSVAWSWRAYGSRMVKIFMGTSIATVALIVAYVMDRGSGGTSLLKISMAVLAVSFVTSVLFSTSGGVVPVTQFGSDGRHAWYWRTLRHALAGAAIAVTPFAGLVVLLAIIRPDADLKVLKMMLTGIVAISLWLANVVLYTHGGDAIVQHLTLRGLLGASGSLPWRLYAFLDHCVELTLLRRVGNGYMFLHDALQQSLNATTFEPDAAQDTIRRR